MSQSNNETNVEPTDAAVMAFMKRGITGPVVMLNLIRFRAVADYYAAQHLAPAEPISGEAAYRRYIDHTLPILRSTGGDISFLGTGGGLLIGPANERWDLVMLVRQTSVLSFLAFASHAEYLAGLPHREAAVEDSRLLPIVESEIG